METSCGAHILSNTHLIYILLKSLNISGWGTNTGPRTSTELPTGLVWGLLQSELGVIHGLKNRKGYDVTENQMSGPNKLVVIPDVILLPRT